MRAAIATLMLFSLLAPHPVARKMTLVLPHAPRADESAWLVVSLGPLPRGAEIEITTPSGQLLGVISPYGIRTGSESGTYTVPLPANVIQGRRVSLLVSLDFNGKQRAPTTKEVKKVRVRLAEGRR